MGFTGFITTSPQVNCVAAEQGAAPDRLQLRSFLAPLPAAGELGRCVAAPALMHEAGSTLAAGSWSCEVKVGGVGVLAGRGLLALARRLGFEE